MLYCCVLLQGFALILIILTKLLRTSIKEVSISVTNMGRPERAWGLGWSVWGAEHGLAGIAYYWTGSACVLLVLPLERSSVVELDCGFAARENRKRLWTNSWVSKEKAQLYLSLVACVVVGYFFCVTERLSVGGLSSSCHAKNPAAAGLYVVVCLQLVTGRLGRELVQ